MGAHSARWSSKNIPKALEMIARDQDANAIQGKQKYNVKPKVYNGKRYDSTKEANFRRDLDIAAKAEAKTQRVVKVEEQVTYKLAIDGILICKYILDFRVTYATGLIRYVDVKGYKKGIAYRMFKLKKQLMLALHSIAVEEV